MPALDRLSGFGILSQAMERHRIEQALHADVERYRELVNQARDEFSFRLSSIPTGVPSPDGPGYIRQSGDAYRAALRGYIASLRRLNDFLIDGKTPPDLQDEGAQ